MSRMQLLHDQNNFSLAEAQELLNIVSQDNMTSVAMATVDFNGPNVIARKKDLGKKLGTHFNECINAARKKDVRNANTYPNWYEDNGKNELTPEEWDAKVRTLETCKLIGALSKSGVKSNSTVANSIFKGWSYVATSELTVTVNDVQAALEHNACFREAYYRVIDNIMCTKGRRSLKPRENRLYGAQSSYKARGAIDKAKTKKQRTDKTKVVEEVSRTILL